MKYLYILFASLVVSILFLLFPHSGTVSFMFSNVTLSYKQWIQDFGDHIVEALQALVIFLLIRKYIPKFKTSALVYLCIYVADCVDYALTYGDAWTDGPVTFNTLKVCTFASSIAYDFINVGVHKQN